MRRIQQADGSHGGDLHRLRLHILVGAFGPEDPLRKLAPAEPGGALGTAARLGLAAPRAAAELRLAKNLRHRFVQRAAELELVRPSVLLAMVRVDPDIVVPALASGGLLWQCVGSRRRSP